MANHCDHTGKRVGSFIVVGLSHWKLVRNTRLSVWRFRCDCGHEIEKPFSTVSNGIYTCPSCRKSPNLDDITGKTYAGLTVTGFVGIRDTHAYWNVSCHCGKTATVMGRTLKQRKVCLCQKNATKHGDTGSKTYAAWNAMVMRCRNPKTINFHDYGGRGIKVCDRWHTYENFRADMGPKPDGMFLDRIDNDGDYEPGNCRWATRQENNRNRRNSVMITWNGVTQHIDAWSDQFGWPRNILRLRHFRKWSVERMMTTQPRPWP